ncbi:uncharacterized protein [Magallana gigas]|uniref:uncharacterized protein n=1 Tax=Magallana gigas TaxID=29159 RepID=UPI0005C38121|eukprot:XP_011424693.1 PREDICTED: uncharacterized protein LOC105326384 [Crassostrea gigas]
MERDGKDILRRLNSDKLMSPTPEMLRELPLSDIGERAERYHRIMMARTRTQILLMDNLCQQRGLNMKKILERQRWERTPESDLGPLVGLKHEAEDDLERIKLRIIKPSKKRSSGHSADDRVASFYRLNADDEKDNLHEYNDGCEDLFRDSQNDGSKTKEDSKEPQKKRKSWKKRLLKLFSWCSGSAEKN